MSSASSRPFRCVLTGRLLHASLDNRSFTPIALMLLCLKCGPLFQIRRQAQMGFSMFWRASDPHQGTRSNLFRGPCSICVKGSLTCQGSCVLPADECSTPQISSCWCAQRNGANVAVVTSGPSAATLKRALKRGASCGHIFTSAPVTTPMMSAQTPK